MVMFVTRESLICPLQCNQMLFRVVLSLAQNAMHAHCFLPFLSHFSNAQNCYGKTCPGITRHTVSDGAMLIISHSLSTNVWIAPCM